MGLLTARILRGLHRGVAGAGGDLPHVPIRCRRRPQVEGRFYQPGPPALLAFLALPSFL